MANTYGYARVSSVDQNEARQIVALRNAGIEDESIFIDHKTNGLIGEVIAEIVLQLLSFVAENERRNIRERQRQGIAAARARGVRFGRPVRQLPPQFAECVVRLRNGEITLKTAAAFCDMPESTFRDRMKGQHIVARICYNMPIQTEKKNASATK